MKILHLRSSIGLYGAERVILSLCKSCSSDVQPVICCLNNLHNPHLELLDEAEKDGIETIKLDYKGKIDLKAVKRLRKILISNKIDIVHSHEYKSDIISYLATLGLNIGRIVTAHSWHSTSSQLKIYEALDRWVIRKMDKVISVSNEINDKLISIGINKKKLKAIINGISIESETVKDLRSEFGLKDEPVLGIIARLSEEKGHDYLLRSVRQIAQVYPKVKLLIVGDGPLRQELEQKADSLGVNDNVIFTGFRSDIDRIYSTVDIVVSSSLSEGTPINLMEAMVQKKAIVATDVGNVRSLIKNFDTGIITRTRDQISIANAIINLLGNKNQQQKLGNNAYNLIKKEFSAEVMAGKYETVYNENLKMRGCYA